jgi:UDP-N-acetylmuramoylalanine-D-glutamate ligase
MDHYARTKARLFQRESGKLCILPRDCEYFSLFYDAAGAGVDTKNIITYSMREPCDFYAKHLQITDNGIEIGIK